MKKIKRQNCLLLLLLLRTLLFIYSFKHCYFLFVLFEKKILEVDKNKKHMYIRISCYRSVFYFLSSEKKKKNERVEESVKIVYK